MLPKQGTVRNFLSLMASQERDILVQHENIVAVAHELDSCDAAWKTDA
jgi:hypothetical protein